MQTSNKRPRFGKVGSAALSNPEMIVKIQTFCNIAKANNASLSVKELLSLVPLDMTERDLVDAWQDCAALNDDYWITEGIIAEKNGKGKVDNETRWKMADKIRRAKSNMQYASRFRAWMRNNDIVTLAVSGSTSYQSSSETDDLDFFLVAKNGVMWINLTISLILARCSKLIERGAPPICLSFVADTDFAESHFATNHNGLIARDALLAKILLGDCYYTSLLEKNRWIKGFYPKLYQKRSSGCEPKDHSQTSTMGFRTTILKRVLNLFLYKTVGNYIKFKSDLLNRRLMKRGQYSSLFELRIGIDHCIYESRRYQQLRKMYSKLDPKSV